MGRKPSHLGVKLAVLAVCLGVLALWVGLALPCPIRRLTGVICPGCGMGRAWLAALRLDLGAAFRYHPMFWSVPLAALFLIYDCRLFRNDRWNVLALGAMALGLLACYLARLPAWLAGYIPI